MTTDFYAITNEEALEEIGYAPADIEEAQSFAARGQFITAIGIIESTTRTMERIIHYFPALEADVKPIIDRAIKVTRQIINDASLAEANARI